jgi:hypothetical protein
MIQNQSNLNTPNHLLNPPQRIVLLKVPAFAKAPADNSIRGAYKLRMTSEK